VPATTYPFDIVNNAAYFIKNFAEINGIPQPAAHSGRAKIPLFIYQLHSIIK